MDKLQLHFETEREGINPEESGARSRGAGSLLSAWWGGAGKPCHPSSPPTSFLGRWVSGREGKRAWLRRTEDPALWALRCLYLSVTQQTQSSKGCEDSPWGGRKGRERSHCPSSHDLVIKLGSLPLMVWLELPRKEESVFALPHHCDYVTCLCPSLCSCLWLHLWPILVEAG